MTIRSADANNVETIILPPVRDVDGFTVRRALPSAHRRMVGPFIFFDLLGPAVLEVGDGFDVRPHPHIGLATVTYQMAGEVIHRDNLGAVQAIQDAGDAFEALVVTDQPMDQPKTYVQPLQLLYSY